MFFCFGGFCMVLGDLLPPIAIIECNTIGYRNTQSHISVKDLKLHSLTKNNLNFAIFNFLNSYAYLSSQKLNILLKTSLNQKKIFVFLRKTFSTLASNHIFFYIQFASSVKASWCTSIIGC